MHAHCLQHVSFEGIASIKPWLDTAGYELTTTRFFESPELPDPSSLELLIIMGGPMSVKDEVQYPWIIAEKKFIRDVILLGTPVLGICLGAQLIASAMGATIYKSPLKEIGWFPIHGIAHEDRSIFNFPASVEVFHWHGETFALPQGAIHLAESDGCKNQAFQLGKSVIGLQFHLESSAESVQEIVSHCRDELIPSRYIQSEQKILAAKAGNYKSINLLVGDVLSFIQQNNNEQLHQ